MTLSRRARVRPSGRRAARTVAAGLAGLLGLRPAAGAEPVGTVVEMFTSQGCAACGAADPVMRELARRPGVIALTLPVTVWDYLGWKDTLALRPLTERQRAYARARGGRQVFTPQAVVDGEAVAVGSDRSAVDRLMREAAQRGLPVPVRGEARGDRIVVEVGALAAVEGREALRGEVWLVPVLRSRAVAVEAGESRGRTLTYVNVVRGLKRLGAWSGQPARFEVPSAAAAIDGADGWVVLVQDSAEGRPGRILGAAKGPGL